MRLSRATVSQNVSILHRCPRHQFPTWANCVSLARALLRYSMARSDSRRQSSRLLLDDVSQTEALAYGAWHNSYQSNWRGTFDPIALRLSAHPAGRMAADFTIMPLIASTDYREFISLVAKAKLGSYAGDLHPESLVHAIMALDMKS